MPAMTCPRCGVECDAGEPRCLSCGGYLGARRRPSVVEQPPEPEPEVSGAMGFALRFLEMFPGFVQPKVLALSLAALPVAAGLLYLALVMAGFGALFTAIAIGAFAAVVYWTALAWMLHGELCMPSEALAEFDGTKWMVFLLLAFAPVSAFFYYVGATGGVEG